MTLLISKANNIEEVFHSFIRIAYEEIKFRNLPINYENVLDDIIQTALLISLREKNEDLNLQKYNEIKLGISKFGSFIINGSFRIDDVIEASAKTAFLAAKLKANDLNPIIEFNENIDLKDLQIKKTEHLRLNKLKKSNKATFYYWYQCDQILTDK